MAATVADVSELLGRLEQFDGFYLVVKPAALLLKSGQILIRSVSQETIIDLTPADFTGSEEVCQSLQAYADAGLCLVQGPWPVAPEGYEWVQRTKPDGVELRLIGTDELPPQAVLHRSQTFTRRSAQLLGTAPLTHTAWSGPVHISHHAPDPAYQALYT